MGKFTGAPEALQYLTEEEGEDLRDVAENLSVDVTGQWLRQIRDEDGRNPSDDLRAAIIQYAEATADPSRSPGSSPDVDEELVEIIEQLHEEHGSWDKLGRRVGVSPNALRLAVTEGMEIPENAVEKIREADRRNELEEVIGFIAVGVGIQVVTALKETDLSRDQRKIVEKGESQLQEYNRLLQTGNIEELKNKIRTVYEQLSLDEEM